MPPMQPMPPTSSRLVRVARDVVRWRSFALPVLVFLFAYTVVLYWRAFAVGVLSDGWVLLEIGSRGFREAPFVLLDYHTIPVTNLLMAVLWKLYGLTEWKYQLTNLAELLLVGWLVYLLGCTLFRQPRVGLLASLLLLANSSFFEVPCWPTVGNFQSLAALLYLLGIFAVHRAVRSPRPWPWLLLFALCGLAAFFTYEPAVSVLGVGILYAVLVPAPEGKDGEKPSWRGRIRRLLPVLGWSLAAAAVVLGSKAYTASLGYQAAFLPGDWTTWKLRIYLLLRAFVGIFSLVGADHKLYKILTFGLSPPGGSPLVTACLILWTALLAGGAVLLLWKSRSGAVRFLTIWLAAHMVMLSLVTNVVSRHFYLGALPGSLLMAWLLWRVTCWVTARFGGDGRPEPRTAGFLALLVVALLAINAKSDIDVAATVHKEATRASRQVTLLVQQRLAETPSSPPEVLLVNMPAAVGRDGISAFSFINGLHQILQLSTQRRVTSPELVYTYGAYTDGKFANASEPITLEELARRAQDPKSLVLTYDPQTRSVVELSRASWRPPEEYDLDSAPFLEWQPGAWPWVRVYAGKPLDLPLNAPESSWMAIRYLRTPGVELTVRSSSGPALEIRAPEDVTPSWPVVTLPYREAPDPAQADVTLDPKTEVWLAGAWPFAPPGEYTPETVPFLPWVVRPVPVFFVEGPMLLPVSTEGCAQPCAVEIEYLAGPGRDFSLGLEGEPVRSFAFGELAAPEWRTERLPAEPGRPAVVRLEPLRATPVEVRRLAAGRPAAGVQSNAQAPPD